MADLVIKSKNEKKKQYSIATVHLQVLGSGAEGAPSSLFVFTDPCRYLFNCGEGCQRLAFEYKVRLSKIDHIFITRKSWKNVGGILGMILTLQDTGISSVNIHGPEGTKSIFDECRSFAQVQNIELKFHEHCESSEILTESNTQLSIKTVPISINYTPVDEVGHHQNKRLKCDADMCLAYICKTPSLPGRLLKEKCSEKGVPVGPLFGRLKNGEDVTLACGKVVTAAEVTECRDPGNTFIVLEIPTLQHLEVAANHESFRPYQKSDNTLKSEIIVHFSPSQIVDAKQYRDFLSLFPQTTKHLFINDQNKCLGLETPHKLQHKLNLLCKRVFPLLNDKSLAVNNTFGLDDLRTNENQSNNCCDSDKSELQNNKAKRKKDNSNKNKSRKLENNIKSNLNELEKSKHNSCDNRKINSENKENKLKSEPFRNNKNGDEENLLNKYKESDFLKGNIISAVTGLCYQVRPMSKLDISKILTLTPKLYNEECYAEEGFKESLASAQELYNKESLTTEEYPNIVFLGTGSCIPNKSRNTSGILVNCSEDKSMILDCGEGTYGQLIRFYGLEKTMETLRKVSAVYISHRHADHHAGLIGLLHGRRKAFQDIGVTKVEKIPILLPARIENFLNAFESNFESIQDDYFRVSNKDFLYDEPSDPELSDHLKVSLKSIDMNKIETAYVRHCRGSYGVSFTHIDGWKLTYSGDTMPCDNLVDIGENCDILIHEATMEDGMEKEAETKTHSTVSQAIEIGERMKAKNIILTHFSQRYARLPMLGKHTDTDVAVAFDNMQVYLGYIKKVKYLYPALKMMFAEDYERSKNKLDKKIQNELASKEKDEEMIDL